MMLPALAPLRPLFVEEPVLPEQAHLLAGLVARHAGPGGDRRTALRPGRLPARPGRRRRRGPAGPVARRRHLGGTPDRGARRDLRRSVRAALPARPDRAGGQPAGRLRHAQLPDPGTEHGHPLPTRRRRPARLRRRPEPFRFVDGQAHRPVGAPGLGIAIDEDGGAARPTRPGTPGATPSGGTPTARSPNGDRSAGCRCRGTDPALGGRWTSLRAAGREWLWHRAGSAPRPRRAR